jgi:hypothetical protein
MTRRGPAHVCRLRYRGSDSDVESLQFLLAWVMWCAVLSVLLVRVID